MKSIRKLTQPIKRIAAWAVLLDESTALGYMGKEKRDVKESGKSMKLFLSKSARKKQETDNFMDVPIYDLHEDMVTH